MRSNGRAFQRGETSPLLQPLSWSAKSTLAPPSGRRLQDHPQIGGPLDEIRFRPRFPFAMRSTHAVRCGLRLIFLPFQAFRAQLHAFGAAMKPDPVPASARWFSRHDPPNGRAVLLPHRVAGFQPRRDQPPGGGGFDGDRSRPGFTRLASEVLRADASRTFRLETAVLGFVTLVSAWPIAIMIHEVIRLLK